MKRSFELFEDDDHPSREGDVEECRDPLDRGLALAFSPVLETGSGSGEPDARAVRASALRDEVHLARYAVEDEMARGGMGVVFRGRDLVLERPVALKVLIGKNATRRDVLERFLCEAQVEAQLQHPGVVPLYELCRSASGRPVLAMKLVCGETFAGWLATRAESDERRAEALRMFERIGEVVAHAHARGVVHRDLKPSNVLIGSLGEVFVVDWGLAKVLSRPEAAGSSSSDHEPWEGSVRTSRGDSKSSTSLAGSVLGTPAYMAPEQARGQTDLVDERVDVFALGAMLCEILTGSPPYAGHTVSETLRRAREAELAPALERLASHAGDADLVALARAALDPDLERRVRDASVLTIELRRHRESFEKRRRDAELARVRAVARAEQERRTHRLVVALGATLALLVLGAFVGVRAWQDAEERRRASLRGGVSSALEEVAALRGSARASGASLDWERCVARGRSALALLAAPEVDGTWRAEAVEELRGDEVELHDALAREDRLRWEHALRDELDRIRSRFADHASHASFTGLLRDTLARAGFDLLGEDPDVLARRLASTSIGEPLRQVLDAWLLGVNLSLSQEGEAAERARLRDLLRALDPDPIREAARTACTSHDPQALAALLEDSTMLASDPHLLALVCDVAVHGSDVALAARAIERLERGVERDPADYWLHATLGHGLSALGSPQRHRCEAAFEAATALRPASSVAWTWWGVACTSWGDTEAARRVFERAIVVDPDTVAARNNLGVIALNEDRVEEAAATFRDLVERHPEHLKAWYNLGVARERLDRLEEALACFDHVLEREPEEGHTLREKGFVLERLGRYREAEAVLRRAVRIIPTDALAWHRLATVTASLGRSGDSRRNLEEALACVDRALQLRPDATDSLLERGMLLFDLTRFREAGECFDRAVSIAPKHAFAWHNVGMARAELGHPAEAEEAYRRAIDLDPKIDWSWHNLGRLLLARDDPAGAEAAFRNELVNHPERWGSWLELGNLYSARQDWVRAIAYTEKARAAAPEDARVIENWAGAMRNGGDPDAAVDALTELLEGGRDDAILRAQLGMSCLNVGRFEEALVHFRAAQVFEPADSVRGISQEAGGLCAVGRWGDAVALLRSKASSIPALGSQLAWCERIEEALQRVEGHTEGPSESLSSSDRVFVGQALIQHGLPERAISWLELSLDEGGSVREGSVHFVAACAAVAVAARCLRNADPRNLLEASDWLARAEEFLRVDLEGLRGASKDEELETLCRARRALARWRHDPMLQVVRDAESTRANAVEDRERWKALFGEAESLERALDVLFERRLDAARKEWP